MFIYFFKYIYLYTLQYFCFCLMAYQLFLGFKAILPEEQ